MTTLAQTTAVPTNSYVQKVFNWDLAGDTDMTALAVPTTTVVNQRMAAPGDNVRRKRVGCEHVGGALANVLGGYGISIDALISEIERIKNES